MQSIFHLYIHILCLIILLATHLFVCLYQSYNSKACCCRPLSLRSPSAPALLLLFFCFLSSSVSIQITLGCLIRARQWERKREASLPYHRSYPRSSPPSFCLSFPLISFHQLYHKQILLIESLRGLLFYMAFHTHCSGNESSRLYMFTGNMHTKRIYCTGQLCHFLIQGQI